jgi:hypothetical protein
VEAPTKGASVRDIEREFVRLGGTVVRDKPGHVIFKFPGLPAVGVHSNRDRAPRRLVSMLVKAMNGQLVTAPRVPEPAVAAEPEPEKPTVKIPVRPNPPRPLTVAPPVSGEVIRETVTGLERRKAHDRAVALARIFNRPEPAPHVAEEEPLVWRKDVIFFDKSDGRHGEAHLDIQIRAFADAERAGMVKWWDEPFGWLEEMDFWLIPDKHRRLPRSGFGRYGIAIVRPGSYGFLRTHTYVFVHEGDFRAVVTVEPAEFARFRASWDQGLALIRRQARKAGVAV